MHWYELRKKAKNDFEKDFKSINNAVVMKIHGKYKRNFRNFKLITSKAGENDLVSEPNYHTAKLFFSNIFSAMETRKTNID